MRSTALANDESEMFSFLPGFSQLNGQVCNLEILNNKQWITLRFYNWMYNYCILSFYQYKIRELRYYWPSNIISK